MAAAKDNAKVNDNDQEAPASAYPETRDNGAGVGREGQVGEAVTSTFDERTGVSQPFLKEDGTQDNGAVDLEAEEGARAPQTREGDKSTVEETKVAAENGDVPKADAKTPEKDDSKPKNPVN